MRNENYILIQAWMITDLKLSGNELLLYALIYGFCQDGESCFNGSLSYMMEWLNLSKQALIDVINRLISKNLLSKVKNGQKCFYTIVDQSKNWNSQETLLVKKLDLNGKETLPNQSRNLTQ